MTLGIIKRTEEEYLRWISTEWGFLTAFGQLNGEPIILQPYQLQFLMNKSRFRWTTKSRQVGISFIFALECLARCHAKSNHTSVIISYNQDDSKEKILIARQVHEGLPLAYQKRIKHDSKTELAFESNSSRKGESRILSAPSKAPRGKSADVYLDEFAHYANDREVYTGSTALILHGRGQLTGASTPLGRRGLFWEIATEEVRKYPRFSRQLIPWWLSSFFCVDVELAAKIAWSMDTEARVYRFGTSDLIAQYEALPIDDFRQEFEIEYIDTNYSYFPYELILPCTDAEHEVYEELGKVPAPVGRIVAGFDVGRMRDRSELAVFEEVDGQFIARLFRSFKDVPFATQEAELRELLDTLPVARLSIDKNGIGMHLTENLSTDYPVVQGESFSTDDKERWATNMKILFQKRKIVLPADRNLVSETHSIKRRVLPSGRVSFDAEKIRSGHADRFWAVAMACQKERNTGHHSAEITARIIG